MPEKKMNWGTLILGIIIGAIVVGVVWMASKPAPSSAVENRACGIVQGIFGNVLCDDTPGGGPGCSVDPEIQNAILEQICGLR